VRSQDKWVAQSAAIAATTQLELAGPSWEQEIDVFSIIERARILLMFRPMKRLFGAYIPGDNATGSREGILINSNHPRSVQRYTAAHEFAHHIQDTSLSLDTDMEVLAREQQPVLSPKERFAEHFASWFLMPPQLITNLARRLDIPIRQSGPEAIYQLSLALGTSYRATITQLASLREISWSHANRLRDRQPREIKQEVSWSDRERPSRNDTWIITKEYHDLSVHPRVGDELLVHLSETPSTGYVWVGKHLETAVSLTDHRFAEVEGELVSARGLRRFRFMVQQPSESSLVMSMQRPWLGDESEVDSLHLRLIVENDRLGINPEMLLADSQHALP